MKGTMLMFAPGAIKPIVTEFDRAMTLEELKAGIGGGYLEVVPYFKTIAYAGTVMDCVALCDEDGKLKELPFNPTATSLWDQALRRNGSSVAAMRDELVGPVAVVFGDRAFMSKL